MIRRALSLLLVLILSLSLSGAESPKRKGDKKVWKAHQEEGLKRWQTGDISGAIQSYRSAIDEAALYSTKEYHLALSHYYLGTVHLSQNDRTEAIAQLENAVAAAQKVKGRNVPEMVLFLQRLAAACRLDQQFTKAEGLLEEGRKLIGIKLGQYSFAMRICLDELGRVQLAQGKLSAAEKSFKESLEISSKPQYRTDFARTAEGTTATTWEYRDPFTSAEALNGLGLVQAAKRDPKEAAKWLAQAAREAEKSKHYWVEPAWNLAEVQVGERQFDLAAETLTRALSRQKGASPRERYETLRRLGLCHAKAGETEKLGSVAISIGSLTVNPPNAFGDEFAKELAGQVEKGSKAETVFRGLVGQIETQAGTDSVALIPYLHQLQVALREDGRAEESDTVNGRALTLKLKHGL